jgi:hypothetical protein
MPPIPKSDERQQFGKLVLQYLSNLEDDLAAITESVLWTIGNVARNDLRAARTDGARVSLRQFFAARGDSFAPNDAQLALMGKAVTDAESAGLIRCDRDGLGRCLRAKLTDSGRAKAKLKPRRIKWPM